MSLDPPLHQIGPPLGVVVFGGYWFYVEGRFYLFMVILERVFSDFKFRTIFRLEEKFPTKILYF